jgi:hypothetical protein
MESFSVDLGGENNTGYEKCIASVATAAGVSNLSSYEKKNDLIDIGLYHFYIAMLKPDNKEKVKKDAEKIRGIFSKLNINP